MDKLEEIFRMQDALNRRIGVALPPGADEEKVKWILNYTRAMQQELAELVDSVPWKWWAKYQEFDQQNAKVEIVDLFHGVHASYLIAQAALKNPVSRGCHYRKN